MGLFIVCQNRECRNRNGEDRLRKAKAAGEVKGDVCLKCEQPLKNSRTGTRYGIEYHIKEGSKLKLKRELNRNWTKKEAEYRLNEVQNAKAEGGYIPQRLDAKTTFRDLAQWYLSLAVVKAKRSYDRDRRSVGKLTAFFGNHWLRDITPAMVEEYLHGRLNEPSYRGHSTKPATVNRELACLNYIFSQAVRNGRAKRNPVKGVKRPPENNTRDRVLTYEEYKRLIAECPPYVEPIVKLAYYAGMRRGEILKLTWDMIDLRTKDKEAIHLTAGMCKTNEGRFVPLNPELVEMFKAMPHGLPGIPVFTRRGKPATGSTIRVGFEIACRQAGIEDFTFHDLRHTFVTNRRRAGVHESVIMAITGHKTRAMFDRYNSVSQEEMKAAVEVLEKPNVHQNVHYGQV